MRAHAHHPHAHAHAPRPPAGPDKHELFLKVVGGDDPDAVSRELTRDLLRYVAANLGALARLGIAVSVRRVRSADLRDARLVAAMRARGVSRLPALLTPRGAYVGARAIRALYARNLAQLAARGGAPAAAGGGGGGGGGGDDGDDEVAAFYAREMTSERAEAEADERDEALDGAEDMMDRFRRASSRRDLAPPRPGRVPAAIEAGARAAEAEAGAPARAAAGRPRPNNVAAGEDPDEAEFAASIARLARPVDEETRSRAFAGEEDGDGEDDPRDRLMEQSYWQSREESS